MKSFNRNFIFILIGQVVSLFGNTLLRFALPLYVLDQTGNAAIFGVVLAISLIPTILCIPFGGILADRINKKWIMVILDIITTILIIIFFLFYTSFDNQLIIVCITLILLSIIQSFYQPAVQSSVPLVLEKEDIVKGNASVSAINSLANLSGPLLGGILYGIFSLDAILIGSIICFSCAVLIELFIKMPHIKQKEQPNFIIMIKEDIKESIDFIFNDNKAILNVVLLATFINLILSALMIVGYPIFITRYLGLSSTMYGVAEAILAVGTITGALLISKLNDRLNLTKFHLILLGPSFFLLIMMLPFIFNISISLSYSILLLCGFSIMLGASIFSIKMLSILQEITPQHILGKVMSYVFALSMLALPLGQVIYGYLFNILPSSIYIIILIAALFSLVIALVSKKVMYQLNKLLVSN